MLHRDEIVLRKIVSELDIGMRFVKDVTLDSFLGDEVLKRAVAMTEINVGELVKALSADLKAKHPEIPWRAIAGMRDIAAHKYVALDMEEVFLTGREDFPELKKQINNILQNPL